VKSLREKGLYLRAVQIGPSSLTRGLWTNTTSSKKVIRGLSKERKEDLILLKNLIETGSFRPILIKNLSWHKLLKLTGTLKKDTKGGNMVITLEHSG
jgi:hypothetical protein